MSKSSSTQTRNTRNGADKRINDDESPLVWLRRRKDRSGAAMISQAQFEAGERLRAEFWFAQMTPRTTTNWSAMSPTKRGRRYGSSRVSASDMIDSASAAAERVRKALAAVGPELSGVLVDVCCHLKGLEEAERAAGWPQRSGKIVLQLALSALARHYGITRAAENGSRASPTRHWGAEDFRPLIDGGE
ncbi:DUF6456 domain-containing protein [Hyphomicrobium sulfonivorans]|nr:DUF6456 domain-containing protein [Hyphomicrobium sulfonivorans]